MTKAITAASCTDSITVHNQTDCSFCSRTLGRLFPDPDHDGPAATERDDETAGSDLKVHLNVKKKSLQMFQMFRLQLLSLLGVGCRAPPPPPGGGAATPCADHDGAHVMVGVTSVVFNAFF
ncbi:hypothetical protein KUCAC02_008154 [Chaenocephalus aceratus]|uniref:Uncharacterized protein n=1 Tax=Chaenocephalus aceratus TaxID=36190 RepID=A0ACB9X8A0_CHAAC|nr:hypothetical protein KUCAC02_008154 [Chaenocephalus aceratus]